MTSDEIIIENKICNNEFEVPGSCPQNSSSSDNSLETIKKCQNGHTIDTNFIGDIKNMVLIRLDNFDNSVYVEDFVQQFFDNIKRTQKDRQLLSHAKSLHMTLKRVSLTWEAHEEYISLLINHEFITAVLSELKQTNSLQRKKGLLKKMCVFYFDVVGISPMDPRRVSVIRLIDQFSNKPRPSKKNSTEVHPYVISFTEHLTEHNFKWQRNAKIDATYLLKWLVENNLVSAKNHWEVDVREITKNSLDKFREHLMKRIENNSLKKQSAQKMIQSIKQWFRYLKLFNYIFADYASGIKNFSMKGVKTNLVLLTKKEFDAFFKAILEHSKDVLRDMALFSLMATMAMRASEVLNVKECNIDFSNHRLKFIRKGGDETTLPLSGISGLYLDLYNQSLPGDRAEFWLNAAGTRLRYESVVKLFRKYAKLSGLTKNVGACHVFRRMLITELCYQGYSLEDIQDLSDIKSQKVLNRYIYPDKAKALRNFKNKFKTLGGDKKFDD